MPHRPPPHPLTPGTGACGPGLPPPRLGYDGPLYMLAFDHRGSFQKKLLGIRGQPSPSERGRVVDAKRVIFEGFELAIGRGAPEDDCGLLVDEEFGADIARAARAGGHVLAMPTERSGQDEFELEYGADFDRHIEAFDPTFVKVLVRYNPEGDRALNERQAARLVALSAWLRDRDRKFLFELLVPATAAQLERVGRDPDRYDLELRPGLMVETIRELQDRGVEPDIWKIEGLDRREDCERVAEQARSGGRDGVACLVLGRGSSAEKVYHWLRQGAGVPGFIGFAVGRTLWWDALAEYTGGSLERSKAAAAIADNYLAMIETYASAASASSPAS